MTHFRLSTERDLSGILLIVEQAKRYLAAQGIDQWQDGYPNEDVMREDIRCARSYVLLDDGVICGMATILLEEEPSYAAIFEGEWTTPLPYACIHRIAVLSDRRGTGLADTLMKAAEQVIRSHDISSIRIDTHPDNKVMQRMLNRNGYLPCGVIYLHGGKEQGAKRIALEKRIV